MSLSSLFFIGIGFGLYKLGAFNERHPGEAKRRAILTWSRLCHWLSK